ncbi:uncharacterized protein PV07_02573 [Cladophialophora immunda]|uniref:Uncharacterized protein n=1 Tax=Cladophialophora immunda TaxID=569365 RepID=A0A0D1ZS45_9EURO|nr:uncharacterized protein PV07_02573 [Cladophialophora immunda]KIW30881.1 hypothetical protein PV07_02573 [Cladophialophora immunda]OQV02218.1 hypothetical protein CLAIMM_07452 [Cladophialophora immunda]
MAAGVRDPAFWKRFSMAVHLDEEKANISETRSTSTASSTAPLRHTETWLERNRRKQRRTRIIGCLIALAFIAVIVAVVLVLLWFAKVGPFKDKSS